MTSKLNEDVVQGWRDGIPLKRGGTTEDVAAPVFSCFRYEWIYYRSSVERRRRNAYLKIVISI
jgi:hypothetical protein